MALSPRTVAHKAFTLVEVLVVIAIIVVLMGIMFPVVTGMLGEGDKAKSASLVQQLSLAVEVYEGRMGDAPPSSWKRFGTIGGKSRPYKNIKPPSNDINTGAECLFIALTAEVAGVASFEWEADHFENIDGDKVTGVPSWDFGDECNEIVDAWGQPIIYIHNRDYGKKFKVMLPDGEMVEVQALKSKKLKGYYKKRSYQLFSLGEDGKPGTTDDLANFRLEDEAEGDEEENQ
ncbi:MAG: prepilin-type N-terminal cleavage/methylation domain-containing protein [Planctomycetota bacterium]|jgi:prepilin-type N-terminal cleavage/methylation domain-containing protein